MTSSSNDSVILDDYATQYLSYIGKWTTQDPTAAAWNNNFNNQTFHVTSVDGDYLRILWEGTGIAVFGAMRANHGQYSTSLDWSDKLHADGYTANDVFNATLFAVHGLTLGQHELRIYNEPARADIASRNGQRLESSNEGVDTDISVLGIDSVIVEGTPLEWNATAASTTSAAALPVSSTDYLEPPNLRPTTIDYNPTGSAGVAGTSNSSSLSFPSSLGLLSSLYLFLALCLAIV